MTRLVISLPLLLLLVNSLFVNSLEITVSYNGTDDSECLKGKEDCESFEYALNVFESIKSDVTITLTSPSHILTKQHLFEGLSDILITSSVAIETDNDTVATVTCEEIGTGISISGSTNIKISYIEWINCSIHHPTSALGNWSCNGTSCEPFVTPRAYSNIYLYNCTNFTLSHCRFTSNRGSGLSLYNMLGHVLIENSKFSDHVLSPELQCTDVSNYTTNCSVQSTGLYIEVSYCQSMAAYCYPDLHVVKHVSYHIRGCVFEGNRNDGTFREETDIRPIAGLARENHWPFGKGGGMGVVLRPFEFKYLNVTVEETCFHDNRAVYGGGMYLHLEPGYSDHGFFNIISSNFTNNEAFINGGGLDMAMNVIIYTNLSVGVKKSLRNYLTIEDSLFMYNKAYWGGGASLVTYPCNVTYLHVHFISSKWAENNYVGGGGAVGILRKEKPEQLYFFIPIVNFTNCNFTTTRAVLTNGTSSLLSCTVYSEGIPLLFHGITLFENNCASGLCLSDTGATFFDVVKFINNTGFNGGALFLTGKAYMTVATGVVIDFIDNSAYQYGGAIYYLAPPPLEMNTSGSCFVWLYDKDNENVPLRLWWITVRFKGNKAVVGGDVAYISDPEKCAWPNEPSLFNPSRVDKFNYSQQNHSRFVISTPIKGIRFKSHKSIVSKEDALPVHSLMPGEQLQITVETYDDFDQHVQSVLSIECHNVSNYLNSVFSHDICEAFYSDYDISSRLVQSNTQLNNIITGPQQSLELVLVFRVCQPVSILQPLRINLTECNRGYIYRQVNGKYQCTCVDFADTSGVSGPLLCVNDDFSSNQNHNTTTDSSTVSQLPISQPCVRRHYWAGILHNDSSEVVYQFCHTGKCSQGHQCSHYKGYLKLPDPPCLNQLSGPLCSTCDDNHGSLTYNSYSCRHCNTGHKVGLVLLMLLGCIVTVVVILVFLRLNIRVSTAIFYGFLYFYSVLPMFLWVDLPVGLQATIAIISSVASLDFTLLQYCEFCLFDGVRSIHYEFIHYLYPVTVVLFILIIIKLDQYCHGRIQLFTGNGAVQALCIMLLIAYTSVSETSLKILLPLRYHGADNGESLAQLYVYVDPGLKYLDVKQHLPYWLVALVVECGFIIPFAVLVMVAPYLMRCVNLSRIKPVLDEYQNCFYDDKRWFAGVYLLARQGLFLISMTCSNLEQMSYVQQIFCLLLLILVATIQPYRSRFINRMDIFFLLLLTIISFSGYNATSTMTFHNETLHIALLSILGLLPFVTILTGFVAIGIYSSIIQPLKRKRNNSRLQHVLMNESDDLSVSSLPNYDETLHSNSTNVSLSNDDGELPPRFYDEEHDERVRLLRTAPKRVGMAVGPLYRSTVTNKHSINNGPAHHTN